MPAGHRRHHRLVHRARRVARSTPKGGGTSTPGGIAPFSITYGAASSKAPSTTQLGRRGATRLPRPPVPDHRASSRGRRRRSRTPPSQIARRQLGHARSSVSGERPNSPSAPTGAGMICTSGMQPAPDRRADAVGADEDVALDGSSVGERQHGRRSLACVERPPPRSRDGRRRRVRRAGSGGTCAGRCSSAGARRRRARRCAGIVVSSLPCRSTTTETSWRGHRSRPRRAVNSSYRGSAAGRLSRPPSPSASRFSRYPVRQVSSGSRSNSSHSTPSRRRPWARVSPAIPPPAIRTFIAITPSAERDVELGRGRREAVRRRRARPRSGKMRCSATSPATSCEALRPRRAVHAHEPREMGLHRVGCARRRPGCSTKSPRVSRCSSPSTRDPQAPVEAVDRLVGARVRVRGDRRSLAGPRSRSCRARRRSRRRSSPGRRPARTATWRGPSPARRKYGTGCAGQRCRRDRCSPRCRAPRGSTSSRTCASAAPNFSNGGGLGSTWGYAGPAYGVPVKSKKRSQPAGAIGPMNWL